jgi:hypothetical protein
VTKKTGMRNPLPIAAGFTRNRGCVLPSRSTMPITAPARKAPRMLSRPNTAITMSTGEPAATEIGHGWFGKGPSERDLNQRHLVGGLLHVTYGSVGARG